jgi:hypothetical protein
MLVLDAAIALPGASSREINRRLKAGGIHFTERAQGLLICLAISDFEFSLNNPGYRLASALGSGLVSIYTPLQGQLAIPG